MGVGLTPVTRDEQFAAAQSGDMSVSDLPEAVTNVEKYLKYAAEHGGGGGGFTPTDAQLAAMNSGIDSTKVEQIETNKNNILTEQSKTTGMMTGGTNYITVNGIRVYVSATAPTGARTGDLWIGG